jgi:mono/diheme cytochrome c family protein
MSRLAKRLLLLALPLSACRADGELPPTYRGLAVPKDRLASADARSHGRALFLEHCALCHGASADGKGVRSEGFSSQPRDFTDPNWRRATTPRRVFYAVREGVSGTAMPSWKALDEKDCWDVTAYVLSVSEGGRR